MILTNGDIYEVFLKTKEHAEVARFLLEKYGDSAGSFESLKSKIRKIIQKRPRKGTDSDEVKFWNKKEFLNLPEVMEEKECETEKQDNTQKESDEFQKNSHGGCRQGAGRNKVRLSDCKTNRTARSILKPKIDELLKFATEQGVEFDEVLEMFKEIGPKKVKKIEIEIPHDDALGFFFNAEHSSRSWTELRLFLLKYGVVIPTRNDIDEEKKKLLPPISVEEIKSSIDYGVLIEDTVKGECNIISNVRHLY